MRPPHHAHDAERLRGQLECSTQTEAAGGAIEQEDESGGAQGRERRKAQVERVARARGSRRPDELVHELDVELYEGVAECPADAHAHERGHAGAGSDSPEAHHERCGDQQERRKERLNSRCSGRRTWNGRARCDVVTTVKRLILETALILKQSARRIGMLRGIFPRTKWQRLHSQHVNKDQILPQA